MAKRPVLNRPIEDDQPRVPRATPLKRNIDFDLLTDEDRERITKEAEAKIAERAKLEAEKAFYAKEVERLERDKYPEIFEEKCEITLNLADYAVCGTGAGGGGKGVSGIMLDGKVYLHGGHYTVPRSVYMVLREQEQASHRHEESLHAGDPYHTFYRRERALQAGVKNDPNSIQISARDGITVSGRPYTPANF